MKILSIETSCDDTCVSIYDKKKGISINKVINQNKFNKIYGGIIPNIASKYHVKIIDKIILDIIKKNNILLKDISIISYTGGPGLFSSLITGAYISKSLSYTLKIPSIPINHLEGHLFSPMINNNLKIKFPLIGLIISGGNTKLIKASGFGKYKVIGKTLDDSIGESFDKISRLLGINFFKNNKLCKIYKKNIYKFPRPMIKSNNFNFSFSGLKTYILYILKSKNFNLNIEDKYNIANEFENSIIDILIFKTIKASKFFNIKNIFISGGVSSNIKIRNSFKQLEKCNNIKICFPKIKLSTDNALMISHLSYMIFKKYKKKIYYNFINNHNVYINSKWKIEDSHKLFNI